MKRALPTLQSNNRSQLSFIDTYFYLHLPSTDPSIQSIIKHGITQYGGIVLELISTQVDKIVISDSLYSNQANYHLQALPSHIIHKTKNIYKIPYLESIDPYAFDIIAASTMYKIIDFLNVESIDWHIEKGLSVEWKDEANSLFILSNTNKEYPAEIFKKRNWKSLFVRNKYKKSQLAPKKRYAPLIV